MNLLVTAATAPEIAPFCQFLEKHTRQAGALHYYTGLHDIHILISGVGCLFTTYHLQKRLSQLQIDLAIQAGIAGSFSRNLQLGDTVVIAQEVLADLGVQDHTSFKDLFDIDLLKPNEAPFREKALVCDLQRWPQPLPYPAVKGITVNTVSGHPDAIAALVQRYHPDVESMEGAAFHYVCLQEGLPFLQLRSISNYVETRDKNKWNIPLAIKKLNEALWKITEQL